MEMDGKWEVQRVPAFAPVFKGSRIASEHGMKVCQSRVWAFAVAARS